MPTFNRQGDLFIAALITGPSHVWLGIRFSKRIVEKPKIVKRQPVGSCSHGELSEESICDTVKRTIDDLEFGRYASEIEYVANDSPRYGMYARCTELIIREFGDQILESV